jgi:hypothetical protein
MGRWKKTAAVAALSAAMPALQANQAPLSFDQRLLASHNRERASLGLPPMAWDARLAADAAAYARQLTRVGHLVHSEGDANDPDPQGENLWAGTKGYYGPEEMVGLWNAERKNFRPGVFPTNSRTGELEDVGHYTQIVWAMARGTQDDFLVCRYSEGGNVIGEVPY